MKRKNYPVLLLLVMLLIGCNRQVITVAGIETQEQEDGSEDYIEIKEFELKQPLEEYDGNEVMFCAVLIPAGYQESEEIPGMYIHERYPIEASNIYYSTLKDEEGGDVSEELTKERYEKLVEEAFREAGMKTDIEISSFEQLEMEGVPAYRIRSSYAKDTKRVQQLTYMILAEDTHVITYTQMSDDEMMEDYTMAEGEIKLVIKK